MKIEAKLINGCKAKDRAAQKQLYDKLLPYLASVCRRYLFNLTDLNDVLQETFISVFKSIDSFDESRASFHTWAVKIAINSSLRLNKQMYKMNTVEFDNSRHGGSETPEVLSKFSEEELLSFLKTMPHNYFAVFNLYVVDGFSHQEIGEQLNIEIGLSRKRLSRARAWLADKIDSNTYAEAGALGSSILTDNKTGS